MAAITSSRSVFLALCGVTCPRSAGSSTAACSPRPRLPAPTCCCCTTGCFRPLPQLSDLTIGTQAGLIEGTADSIRRNCNSWKPGALSRACGARVGATPSLASYSRASSGATCGAERRRLSIWRTCCSCAPGFAKARSGGLPASRMGPPMWHQGLLGQPRGDAGGSRSHPPETPAVAWHANASIRTRCVGQLATGWNSATPRERQ